MKMICRVLGIRPSLAAWESAPFSPAVEQGSGPGDNRDVYEAVVATEAPGPPEPDGPFRLLAREILGFRIFPPELATGLLRREPVETGDTVGISYHFLPGIDLFFASRVIDLFDRPEGNLWKTGFTYRTLRGHPETGEETFSVEKKLATGGVSVALRSWSRPGLLLSRLLKRFTRRQQIRAGRAALEHLGRVVKDSLAVAVG
jgi:Domain of unknown function (DUF1990)